MVCHVSIAGTNSPLGIVSVKYHSRMHTVQLLIWQGSSICIINLKHAMQICTLVWNSGPVCPRNFNENKQRWPTLAHQLFPDNRWLLQDFIFALGQSLIFITQVWRQIYLSNFCSYRIDPNKIRTVRTCPMCHSGFVAEMKRKSISAVHILLFSSLHNTLLHKAYFSGKKKKKNGGGERWKK